MLMTTMEILINKINDGAQIWVGPFLCYLGVGNAEVAKTILSTAGQCACKIRLSQNVKIKLKYCDKTQVL